MMIFREIPDEIVKDPFRRKLYYATSEFKSCWIEEVWWLSEGTIEREGRLRYKENYGIEAEDREIFKEGALYVLNTLTARKYDEINNNS